MDRPFVVIDNRTGEKPVLESIALNEEWAKDLVYSDMEGFVLDEDGNLLLIDECGHYAWCPEGRFTVLRADPPEPATWPPTLSGALGANACAQCGGTDAVCADCEGDVRDSLIRVSETRQTTIDLEGIRIQELKRKLDVEVQVQDALLAEARRLGLGTLDAIAKEARVLAQANAARTPLPKITSFTIEAEKQESAVVAAPDMNRDHTRAALAGITEEEKQALDYLDWSNDTLGRMVRAIAQDLARYRLPSWECIEFAAATLVLVDFALRCNAETLTHEWTDVHRDGESKRNWSVVVQQTKKGGETG